MESLFQNSFCTQSYVRGSISLTKGLKKEGSTKTPPFSNTTTFYVYTNDLSNGTKSSLSMSVALITDVSLPMLILQKEFLPSRVINLPMTDKDTQ
jgi:hypothetical protein